MPVGSCRRVWAFGLILVGGLACLPRCGQAAEGISGAKSPVAQPAAVKERPKETRSEQIKRVAERMFAITDAVLDHHIEPASRQEMILSGLRAAFASKRRTAPDLGRRVSDVRTLDELTSLLEELWPKQPGEASSAQIEAELFRGLLQPVPGAPIILPAKEARVRAQIQANRYIGIGIALSLDEQSRLPQIKHAMPGGPAALGGVKDGDFIEQINNHRIQPDLRLVDVVDELRGPEGSELTIRVRQPKAKESRTYTLLRLPVMFKSVKNSIDGDGDDHINLVSQKPTIAYLKIDSIMASTPRELAAWEPRLRAAKVDGLILDLRGTGAYGSSDNAHAGLLLADSLVDAKSLGKLRTRDNVRELPADRECLFRGLPLAILIDKYTNGPAAWVAAILQDSDPPAQKRRRAVIVGLFGGGDNFTRGTFPLPGADERILPSSVWQRPGSANASKRKIRMYSAVYRIDQASGSWTMEDETASAHRDGVLPDAVVSYYLETRDDVQNVTFDPPISALPASQRSGEPYPKATPSKKQNVRERKGDFDPIADVAIIELQQQLELAGKKS